MLNLMQKDLLTELINTYIAEAASYLSEMVNEKIVLNIPEIDLITFNEFKKLNEDNDFFNHTSHIISSSIGFGDEFTGKAFLMLPVEQAKTLVNACIGEYPESNASGGDFNSAEIKLIDTDYDVLKEISNIILNVVIGEFGNLIGLKLDYSLPEIDLLFVKDSEQQIFTENDLYILMLHTSFSLSESQVNGVILIALSMNSITLLLDKINQLIGDIDE